MIYAGSCLLVFLSQASLVHPIGGSLLRVLLEAGVIYPYDEIKGMDVGTRKALGQEGMKGRGPHA